MDGHDLTTIDFHGATLVAIRGETDATTLVAMKPVAEGMRLDWSAQRRKIADHPVLVTCMVVTTIQMPGDSQIREWVFLPLNRLNFWLATVHPNRVSDDAVRAKVIEYQNECADALYQHFFTKTSRAKRNSHEEEARKKAIAQVRALNAATGLMAEIRRSMGARIAAEAAPVILEQVGVRLSGANVPEPLQQGDMFDLAVDRSGRPN